MATLTVRQRRLRRARRLWYVTVPLIALFLFSGLGRMGYGIRGTTLLQLAHGGAFYVNIPQPEFPQGLFARRDRFFLDWQFSNNTEQDGTRYIYIPLWPVVAVATTLALLASFRARRRPGSGCELCGYDLRGIAGPCPECGSQRVPEGQRV